MARSIAFHRSLLGRSILFGVLPAAALVLLVVALNGYRAWNDVTETLESDLRNATELALREIDLRNQRNTELVKLMVIAQESGQFGRRAETLRALEKILRSNDSVYAAYVAYEPNADGADAAGVQEGVPSNALGAGGRFYPYFKRDPKAALGFRLEPLQDLEGDGGLWYDFPKERFERSGVHDPVITKPYTYLGTDIIENVVPIVINGRFAGVAGLDVALTAVQDRLASIAKRLDADIFLETRGFFIAATTDASHATNLRTTKVVDSKLSTLFRDASIRGVDSWTAVDPESGEQCYFIGGTVPTGQWRMLVRKPITAVTAGVRSMVISNVRTALAGMVVVVVLLSVGALATARRVRVAQRLAERIASGDLSATEVVVRGSDESAELIRAMNAMNVDLAAIVGTVRGACARLAATSTQLAATSQEQRATVGAFGESTSQIAAAIREISATSGELLQTIASVDAGARKSAESAVNGRVRLDAVASTMTHLDGATKDIADRLQVIAEKAAAISSVVIAISKVAEQTNLLSVNAAIEAEKAGDAGLGFLVVAREIRRLADQTGGASLDIERIVGQMQSSVTAGVDEMARFAVEMQQGTGEVKKVAGELGGIVVAINASFASFSDVRTGMSSQSEGVAQIEQAVVQVATGAQQSTAAAEEFGRVANELAHAVAVLQDAAARFQLRSDVGG